MDEMEIGSSSGDEQEFNFLVTKPKKSKRKHKIDPLVIIDRIMFDREDDQEVEDDDDMDFIDDDDLEQNVSFEAPEYQDFYILPMIFNKILVHYHIYINAISGYR